MPESPVFVADAPEGMPLLRDGELFCPECGAALGVEGSVEMIETYRSTLTLGMFGVTVRRDEHDFETAAVCSVCRHPLDYEDVT